MHWTAQSMEEAMLSFVFVLESFAQVAATVATY